MSLIGNNNRRHQSSLHQIRVNPNLILLYFCTLPLSFLCRVCTCVLLLLLYDRLFMISEGTAGWWDIYALRQRSGPNPTLPMLHHLMVGTWTPPGAIFTFEFDDESLSLKLIKKTAIPEDEPISWMTFDVSFSSPAPSGWPVTDSLFQACKEEYIWCFYEEMV